MCGHEHVCLYEASVQQQEWTGAVGRKGGPHGHWGGSQSQGNRGDRLRRVDNQEAGVDAHEGGAARPPGQRPWWHQCHNGNNGNGTKATSAMRTAQRLHQCQKDAGDDASGNFAEEGKFARQLCQEVNLPRMATLPRKASFPKAAILPRRATLLRRAASLLRTATLSRRASSPMRALSSTFVATVKAMLMNVHLCTMAMLFCSCMRVCFNFRHRCLCAMQWQVTLARVLAVDGWQIARALAHAGLKDAIVCMAQLQSSTSALVPLTMVRSSLCSGSQTDRLMQTKQGGINTRHEVLQTSARVRFGAIATSNVRLKMNAKLRRNVKCDVKMNAMLHLGAIANVHDLCSGANKCDDEIIRLRLQSSNDMMQSNVIAILDFVLCHKSIWNELWFVLQRKSMLWCNKQMFVIAVVDFALCRKLIW